MLHDKRVNIPPLYLIFHKGDGALSDAQAHRKQVCSTPSCPMAPLQQEVSVSDKTIFWAQHHAEALAETSQCWVVVGD